MGLQPLAHLGQRAAAHCFHRFGNPPILGTGRGGGQLTDVLEHQHEVVAVQQLDAAHPVGAGLERVARGLVRISLAFGPVVLGGDDGAQPQPFAVGHTEVFLEQVLARAIPPREGVIVDPPTVALGDVVLPDAHHHFARIVGDRGNRPCAIDELRAVALKLPFDTHVFPHPVTQVSQCPGVSSIGKAQAKPCANRGANAALVRFGHPDFER